MGERSVGSGIGEGAHLEMVGGRGGAEFTPLL